MGYLNGLFNDLIANIIRPLRAVNDNEFGDINSDKEL